MAMKKTSGGDSPLWQGAGKSFWTLRSRVDDGGGSRCVSGKLIGYLGFSCRGVFIGGGAASEVDQGSLTHRGRGPGLAAPPYCVAGPWPPPPSPLWFSGSFVKYLDVRLLFRPIPRIFPV
jgi:hypothetical protein